MRVSSIYKIDSGLAVGEGEAVTVTIHYKKGRKYKTATIRNMEVLQTRTCGPVFRKKETAPAECRSCLFYSLKRFFHIA